MIQNAINRNSEQLTVNSLSITGGTIASSSAGMILKSNSTDDITFTNGTSTIFNITSAGYKTNPLLPGFLVYANALLTDVTGNATNYLVPFNTSVYNIGNHFSTDTFTAPVTGKYLFISNITYTGLTSAMTGCRLRLLLTSTTIDRTFHGYNNSNAGTNGSISLCTTINMTAGDTVKVYFLISNGAGNTADIDGGTELETYFCGQLMS
jgi:hypothetical protein